MTSRTLIGRDLSSLLSTLFGASWSPCNYDQQLYRALLLALKSIRLRELHCYFAERDVTVSVVDITSNKDRLPSAECDALVKRALSDWRQKRAAFVGPHYHHQVIDSTIGVVAVAIPDRSNVLRRLPVVEAQARIANVALAVYQRRPEWISPETVPTTLKEPFGARASGHGEIDFVHGIMTSALALLYDIIRQRMRRFSAFSNTTSICYWNDSVPLMRVSRLNTGPKDNLFEPPWDRQDAVAIATLSIDLRKSTFCMEQTENAAEFARLLTTMVQILTKITHTHGGVFDKFTGDGCIIHFLEREQQALFKNKASAAAFDCAVDMQIGISWIVERLRKIIRHDSNLLGAGIGVDLGKSYWSIDHQNNPVVVGRPVVGACRLCGIAAASEIYFTNIAYQDLDEASQRRFSRMQIAGKDLPAELELFAWMSRDLHNAARRNEVYALCTYVEKHGYAEF